MPDLLEQFLNIYGGLLMGVVFIEWGLSLWQNRKFCKKNILSLFLMAIGFYWVISR